MLYVIGTVCFCLFVFSGLFSVFSELAIKHYLFFEDMSAFFLYFMRFA